MSKEAKRSSLLDGLIAGDRKTQRAFYESLFPKMVSIPMRYVGSKQEAYEILNEAFLKVFNTIDRFNHTGTLSGWVARIVFNTTVDHIRKNSSYKKHLVFQESPVADITINEGAQNLDIQEIYKHIQALPTSERAVFSLFAIDGYKHKEISSLLNISVGTSKWYLNNARKKLQKKLQKMGHE